MILHQQILQPQDAAREPWFALHVESLTLAYCQPTENKVRITALSHPIDTANPITNASQGNPIAFAMMIEQDILHHIPGIRCSIYPRPQSHISDLPDYILVNSLDGTTPAILHTADPVALYLADPQTANIAPTEHFLSSIDLTVDGWAYWWEDAQRAFHKLTIEFFQEAGIPVPKHIAEAVKHL